VVRKEEDRRQEKEKIKKVTSFKLQDASKEKEKKKTEKRKPRSMSFPRRRESREKLRYF